MSTTSESVSEKLTEILQRVQSGRSDYGGTVEIGDARHEIVTLIEAAVQDAVREALERVFEGTTAPR